MSSNFWLNKKPREMSALEWESLCDGCGRCCLQTIKFEGSPILWGTSIACKLYDPTTCSCSSYVNRHAHVPVCKKMTPDNVPQMKWLPPTCGYVRVMKGLDLPWWHPLKQGGSRYFMDRERASTKHVALTSNAKVPPEAYKDYIIGAV